MGNPQTHTCNTCGYEWLHGFSGRHNCAEYLTETVQSLTTQLRKVEKERDGLRDKYRSKCGELITAKTDRDRYKELLAQMVRLQNSPPTGWVMGNLKIAIAQAAKLLEGKEDG